MRERLLTQSGLQKHVESERVDRVGAIEVHAGGLGDPSRGTASRAQSDRAATRARRTLWSEIAVNRRLA
jgi:hypothetical protein